MTYATVSDVEDRMGQTVDVFGTARVSSLLALSSALVGQVIGDRTYDEGEIPAIVRAVTVSVVERALRNPEGVTQQTAGPFSVSRPADAVGLKLTPEERDALQAVIGRAGIVSIRTPVTDAFLSVSRAIGSCRSTDQISESDGF